MGRGPGWRARATGLGHRWQARLASRARPRGPVAWPEPRVAGEPARGRRLLKGRLRIGAELVEEPGRSIWELGLGEPEAAALHGFRWLDDLLALGEPRARVLAQGWVAEWLSRYGRGTGPGWVPELSAERLMRLLGHGRVLLHPPGVGEGRLSRAVAAEARFLERRWRKAPAGRARMAALAALVQAGLALPGRRVLALRATRDLAQEAGRVIDAQGGIATRNPEELLDVMVLLLGANQALAAADLPPDPGLGAAIARGAPTLRALRHADGGLARFHGGCRGPEGRLDQVLAAAGRPSLGAGRGGGAPLHMGYLRLAAGRTTVVADAAPPPMGPDSVAAHASTLAFELTSGRRPLVVGIGPGRSFGESWRRAARATASHSTLSLDTVSSARLGPPWPGEEGARIVEGPGRVIAEPAPHGGLGAEMAHDGWRASHGLTHARILHLSPDGRQLKGEDMLTTLTAADAAAFDRALDASDRLGIAFALRFHLHPDIEAEMSIYDDVTIRLPSGEEWAFWHESEAALTIEPSVYLEEGRLWPRPTLQIVLAGRALQSRTRLRWTLAKAYGTPEGLRDLNPRTAWDEEDE